jgi:hypothetical protein
MCPRRRSSRQDSCEHVFVCDRGRPVGTDGSAIVRLHRALKMPNSTGLQIRAIAAELPRIGLEDALAILPALLDREPESFSRNAVRWASRLALERRLRLADSQLVFAALATLPGQNAKAGAEALIELSERYGLRGIDELLTGWLSLGDGPSVNSESSNGCEKNSAAGSMSARAVMLTSMGRRRRRCCRPAYFPI